MITYKHFSLKTAIEIKELYQSVGWSTYLSDDAKLLRAFANSLWVLGAFEDDRLIAFIRCVGDGEHIVYVQDLLVAPPYQKQRIGSRLFQETLDKFQNVRLFEVVTDLTDEVDNHFYQSFGMKPLAEGHMISYYRSE